MKEVRLVLQYIFWAVGLGLNLLVISAMLRSDYRKYRFAFAYTIVLLLTTIVEIAAFTAPRLITKTVANGYYWADEIIVDVVVFCVVIGFIDEAAAESKRMILQRRWLIPAAALIFVAVLLAQSGPTLNQRMTLISRDLNICAVILDLMLWSMLTATRQPNRRLMLLSGGLGMQLTGAIIGESLRNLSRGMVFFGSLVEITTALLGLFVWWTAFRAQESRVRGATVIALAPQQASPREQRTRLD